MNAFTIRIHHYMMIVSTFVCNAVYWLFHIHRLPDAIRQRNGIVVKHTDDIEAWMELFEWTRERGDWRPWIITILARNMRDDCDGASQFARFLFGRMGHEAFTLSLWSSDSKSGHDVCYCPSLSLLVSNNDVLFIPPFGDWGKGVMKEFGNMYTIIERDGKIIYEA